MPHDFNLRKQKDLRRHHRNHMPLPEVILWSRLKGRQLAGLKFRRQQGIGPYVVDFYCAKVRLVIELDGESHFEQPEAECRDAERADCIKQFGATVLRFTNHQIGTSLEEVLDEIVRVVEGLGGSRRDGPTTD